MNPDFSMYYKFSEMYLINEYHEKRKDRIPKCESGLSCSMVKITA